MSSSKVRTVAVVGALGLAASLSGTASAGSTTDPAHPFSDPVWWPLRTPSVVDCTKHNSGCNNHHHFWGIDVLSKPEASGNDNYITDAGVFAMGAGIAHVGDAAGRDCGQQYDSTTFGKWVWVDHGGGVISKYGHLSKIEIQEGQLVSPDTRLGTVGNTGLANPTSCHIYYLDFLVKRNGINGPSEGVEFSTSSVGTPDGMLQACGTDGTLQLWPRDLRLPGGQARVDHIPKKTALPATGDGCRTGVPATTGRARGVKLSTSGAGVLKAAWNKAPSNTDKIRLELGEYHQSTPGWDSQKREKWVDLSAGKTSYKFRDLNTRKLYRVRVWFHTKAGWSPLSSWAEKKTTR